MYIKSNIENQILFKNVKGDNYNYPENLTIIHKTKTKLKERTVYLVSKYKNHATYKDIVNGCITSINFNEFLTKKYKKTSENSGILYSSFFV